MLLWYRRFVGLTSRKRQRASFFTGRSPFYTYLPVWIVHAGAFAWSVVVRRPAGVPEHRADELVRAGGVREARPEQQRLHPLAEEDHQLRGRRGGDDARLRLREREEGEVRIVAGDGIHDRSRARDRHDAGAAARRGAGREHDRAGVAHRPADDQDPAALFLSGARRERLQHGADGARVERRRSDVLRGAQACPARVPTATATARSRMCEMLTASGDARPSAARRSSARPCSATMGWPSGVRRISISRQPTPRIPRPSTFETASFAAHLPARCRTFPQESLSRLTRTKLGKGWGCCRMSASHAEQRRSSLPPRLITQAHPRA